ncbi:ATP-binding protein [Falsiroseomonas tokyonensis]|uniref:ATP-binding protein n=1 Tax=Falsiroseomonas tokyonensis TaxID=430521 RepID=A0ABV7BRN9_9PROT|nr:winged helix-turn-helix domain-containing protein [Falsiroseomonas tokyonensis]
MTVPDVSTLAPPCVWTFGPYRLDASRQALFENDRRMRLGGRAFDILLALVERAGELVSRDDLMARAWPKVFVDESTVRVHVAALRKVLGDGQAGQRYIVNVPGRGYMFASPAIRAEVAAMPAPSRRDTPTHLPALLSRIIGRDALVQQLAAQMAQRRLLTIIGPGGMGKTTLAVTLAESIQHRFADGAHFVDFAALSDPHHLAPAIAAVLDISVVSGEVTTELVTALRGRSLLLILDNCEHLIDASAVTAEKLLSGLPGLHIVATSREPLRAAGEWVHRLSPLAGPEPLAALRATDALAYPAVQLFVERARASLESFVLGDAEAPAVAGICQRLDGIPLAIELAAARVDFFGVIGLAERLDDRLITLDKGLRSGLTRHRTLRGTLDWSHQLLPPFEQMLLRRLAAFRAAFPLSAAQAVVGEAEAGATDVIEGLASLAAKSLLVVDISGDAVRYRLLAMTRAYALEKLAESGEAASIAARHARHCLALLAAAERDWEAMEKAPWLARYAGWIDDVRAALEHGFAPGGERETAIALAAASAPLWFALSLVEEFRGRALLALDAIEGTSWPGTETELQLCLAAGAAIFNTQGPTPAMSALSSRAHDLATRRGATTYQLRALWAMARERYVQGDYHGALAHCEDFNALTATVNDLGSGLVRDRMMALALHLVGRQDEAGFYAERALNHPAEAIRSAHKSFHEYDNRVASRSHLARILWVKGEPDRAADVAEEGVQHALTLGYPPPLCYILAFAACPVAFWNGDLVAAERYVGMLMAHSATLSFGYWENWRRLYAQVLALPASGGVAQPAGAVGPIHADLLGTFHPALLLPAALRRATANSPSWCTAEILRAQGTVLLDAGDAPAARAMFTRAQDIARQQGALAWELRAAKSLAALDGPGAALAAVVARFGVTTRSLDHRQAAALLSGG